ncbi:hypothetical protein SAMN05216474_1797 [Lishizhenia tianjinensis]|uniref:Lipoprotein n=1 Tax=Lishizhenia tianjinensis TaxID=477690 RepID=A0A1I7A0S9_9FLAO|nr:hypothetical protein [Lishizhenia tianjinensis]SFT68546.1 hypothetical protein SAMN05216474_1797 [Lishizhenia tianjinensis]
MKSLLRFIPLLLLLLTACSKTCDLPANENTGLIVQDVLINSTYLKSHLDDGEGIIIRTQDMNEEYGTCTVSFDGGDTFEAINFDQYSLIGTRTSTLCSTTFLRDVQRDDVGKFVNYSITINECEEGCDFYVNTMNWALIPAVDNSYEIEVFLF